MPANYPKTETELDATAQGVALTDAATSVAERVNVALGGFGGPNSAGVVIQPLIYLPASGTGSDLGTNWTTSGASHPMNVFYDALGENGCAVVMVQETKASPQAAMVRVARSATAGQVSVAFIGTAFDVN